MKPTDNIKRIFSIIRFDLANSLRDSMVLYILAAPVILALVLAFLLPSLESAETRLALDMSHTDSGQLAARLERFAAVERLPDQDTVRQRVLKNDSVAGILFSPEPIVLLQGNEPAELAVLAQGILSSALNGPAADYTVRIREGGRSDLVDYSRAFLAMLSILIGGVAAAFALVEEKEAKATRSFAVSPLSTAEYYGARGLWAALVGMVGVTAGHLILGDSGTGAGTFLSALAASLPFPLAICLLIGGLASNQIQAVAALKLVMFVFLTLPLASIFVPMQLEWLFWPLPNYWLFRLFEAVYVPGTAGLPLLVLLCFVSGLLLNLILGLSLARRLSPGRKRKPAKV